MCKVIVRAAVALCVSWCFPSGGYATPTILSDSVFIENRPADDIFPTQAGLRLSLDVNASDTGGTSALLTPPARTQATSSNASFPFTQPVTIPFNAFIPVPGGVEFTNNLLLSGGATAFPNVAGTYTFTVTNSSGQSISDTSHTLDKLEVIPNPTNLHTSNLSTTPVFMFTDPNPTPGVAGLQRFYQAWIYDGTTKVVLDMLPVSSTPSFAIPDGILQPGHPYFLRALSLDIDITETATALHSRLEDRASEFLTFTPVPEPSTLLLLGSGLLGLAVGAWRGAHDRRRRSPYRHQGGSDA